MKKSLFSILFLGMSAIVASAQNVFPTPSVSLTSETPIALSSPEADIMGQSYTSDFTTLESPQSLFTTTTAEASHQRHTDGQRRKFRPHLAGIADIGIGTALDFNLTIGSQLTSFFYLGAGLNTIFGTMDSLSRITEPTSMPSSILVLKSPSAQTSSPS